MTDIGVAPHSGWSLVMVVGTRGWVAALWGQALPGECQRAASGGKRGSPNPERTWWDGGSLRQGLTALPGRQGAALQGVHLMAASAPLSTSSPGLLH